MKPLSAVAEEAGFTSRSIMSASTKLNRARISVTMLVIMLQHLWVIVSYSWPGFVRTSTVKEGPLYTTQNMEPTAMVPWNGGHVMGPGRNSYLFILRLVFFIHSQIPSLSTIARGGQRSLASQCIRQTMNWSVGLYRFQPETPRVERCERSDGNAIYINQTYNLKFSLYSRQNLLN